MKLRPKMGLILGGTIAALVFCSYLIARYYVVTGFERLEYHESQQDVERALGAFATEFREIRTILITRNEACELRSPDLCSYISLGPSSPRRGLR